MLLPPKNNLEPQWLRPIEIGSALISALFIMTLVAIAATAMATRLQIELYRVHLKLSSNHIFLASEAITFWAINALANPNNKFLALNKQGQVLQFPKQAKLFYPDLQVEGGIYDLQGRLNLNNLRDQKEIPFFARAFGNLVPELSEVQVKDLILATQDWISPYDPEKGEDPYLSYYLHQKPPYSISHLPFASISEFRLVKGVSASIYNKMSDHMSTLPEKTPLNINTAPPVLLKALGNGLNNAEVSEFIQARGTKGIESLDKIQALLQKLNIRADQITLQSNYFLVISNIQAEKMKRQTYSLFKRKINKNKTLDIQLIGNTVNTL